ncbi:hypothetical protein PAXINDRAFT_88609 [Paxillus involutus ATCC 200175]|uniref:Tc1-like transposase DDE domain-containing protein n=1 Tax=Paxillus involutus ATCC 200175 TaxID=664439 RepID=A0A0C9TMZ4_PAXIN|nr:hypothetical protein PAXINDRAFT_88609 [Paxillus involutus ATCC 200175]
MKGPWLGRNLRAWGKAFIKDRTKLPTHHFGKANVSRIEDESLAADIKTHLQSLGKYIRGQDIVDYLKDPDIQMKHGFTKSISLATAQRWMEKLGYRWRKEPKGQYSDGHEREDVVKYRQTVFLPAWAHFESKMRNWSVDNLCTRVDGGGSSGELEGRKVVVWFHDESTFYANDRRKLRWVHCSEEAVPQPKGEGASLMVAHFVSADYGWLESPDGKETAQILFKAGKGRDGYYTNELIIQHAEKAIGILKTHYPHDDHVLVFDNATTHVKRADDALSARSMPKNPSQSWGITVSVKDSKGGVMHDADGKPLKTKIPMSPARFANGTPQPLYFPEGHEKASWFKGMAQILRERGFEKEAKLRYECEGFNCAPGATSCCCRRFLFNQPDFVQVESVLETVCCAKGVQVLFLPKFHCELNFIEQCWGRAKRVYRQLPASTKEADLEKNVLEALSSVPLELMRKYATRSRRFIDAYQKGLDGKQAAWAAKKYHGHRILLPSILREFDEAQAEATHHRDSVQVSPIHSL